MKTCRKCQQIKNLDEFYVCNNNPDSLQNLCKICDNEERKLYSQNHTGQKTWKVIEIRNDSKNFMKTPSCEKNYFLVGHFKKEIDAASLINNKIKSLPRSTTLQMIKNYTNKSHFEKSGMIA